MARIDYLSLVTAILTMTILYLLLTIATGVDFQQMIEEVGPFTFAFFVIVQVIVIVAVLSLVLRRR